MSVVCNPLFYFFLLIVSHYFIIAYGIKVNERSKHKYIKIVVYEGSSCVCVCICAFLNFYFFFLVCLSKNTLRQSHEWNPSCALYHTFFHNLFPFLHTKFYYDDVIYDAI